MTDNEARAILIEYITGKIKDSELVSAAIKQLKED